MNPCWAKDCYSPPKPLGADAARFPLDMEPTNRGCSAILRPENGTALPLPDWGDCQLQQFHVGRRWIWSDVGSAQVWGSGTSGPPPLSSGDGSALWDGTSQPGRFLSTFVGRFWWNTEQCSDRLLLSTHGVKAYEYDSSCTANQTLLRSRNLSPWKICAIKRLNHTHQCLVSVCVLPGKKERPEN